MGGREAPRQLVELAISTRQSQESELIVVTKAGREHHDRCLFQAIELRKQTDLLAIVRQIEERKYAGVGHPAGARDIQQLALTLRTHVRMTGVGVAPPSMLPSLNGVVAAVEEKLEVLLCATSFAKR